MLCTSLVRRDFFLINPTAVWKSGEVSNSLKNVIFINLNSVACCNCLQLPWSIIAGQNVDIQYVKMVTELKTAKMQMCEMIIEQTSLLNKVRVNSLMNDIHSGLNAHCGTLCGTQTELIKQFPSQNAPQELKLKNNSPNRSLWQRLLHWEGAQVPKQSRTPTNVLYREIPSNFCACSD